MEWEEFYDEESGLPYYYNTRTGESSWTRGEVSTEESAWEEIMDEETQQIFYYNRATGESAWELPHEYEEENDLSYLEFAAVLLQANYRGKRERKWIKKLVRKRYSTATDEDTQETTYTDLMTYEASTTRPRLFDILQIDEADMGEDNLSDEIDANGSEATSEEDEDDEEDEEDLDDESESQSTVSGTKKRKHPRSKAQQRVDEAEDDTNGATTLDMSNLHAWKLSSRIWDLSSLVSLDLSKNELHRIPSGIQDLARLQRLDVSWNHLTKLPTCLQTTKSLTYIDASHNCMATFSPKLWKLVKLKTLKLSYNQFKLLPFVEGDLKLLRETGEWQVAIGLLQELEVLDVSHNDLTEFPSSLDKCSNLRELDLSANQIQILPDEIENLQNLCKLCMSENELEEIPPTIGQVVKLEAIVVNNNKLTTLPTEMCELTELSELDIRHNDLYQLPEEMSTLQNLKTIVMDKNEHFVKLGMMFQGLPSLRDYTASYCSIARFETNELFMYSPLAKLKLHHNEIREFCISMQFAAMKDTLTELDLEENELSRFPIEVATYCSKLTSLNIAGNRIEIIPRHISELKLLEDLNVSRNAIADLPDTIAHLQSLRIFDCSDNVIEQLPLGIGLLHNLKDINISFNQIKILPASMLGLKNLRSFRATNNLMKVEPSCLRLALHCYCDLSNNPFSEITDAVSECKEKLAQADIYANKEQFRSAEELLTMLIEDGCIIRLPYRAQGYFFPKIYFLRGLCHFMQMKEAKEIMISASPLVVEAQHEMHGINLLAYRNEQSQRQKESSNGNRRLQVHSRVHNYEVRQEDLDKSIAMNTQLQSQAREQAPLHANGAIKDFQLAIQHHSEDLTTCHYLKGLAQMEVAQYMDAVFSFTKALQSMHATSLSDPQFIVSRNHQLKLPPTLSISGIPMLLQRAEAYRRLGKLSIALEDLSLAQEQPHFAGLDNQFLQFIEDTIAKYTSEQQALQTQYFVDTNTLHRAFDADPIHGIPRKPRVYDLYDITKPKHPEYASLAPEDQFAKRSDNIYRTLCSTQQATKDEFKQKRMQHHQIVAKSRAFASEVRSCMLMEQEENRQRTVERELAKLAEKKRQETLREEYEQAMMAYEEEYTTWLMGEEARIENARRRKVDAQKEKEEQQAVLTKRLARRGGRRQQAAAAASGTRRQSNRRSVDKSKK